MHRAGPRTSPRSSPNRPSGRDARGHVPTDDYWPAVVEVCRRHGVLLIADEVMTGSADGRWFGLDHWGVRPTSSSPAKARRAGTGRSASPRGDPRGLRHGQAGRGFVHGFTWSHNGAGAAVAHATLRRLRDGDLVEASRTKGELLIKELSAELEDQATVGDVRGIGPDVGIELVADRSSRRRRSRAQKVTERECWPRRERGLLFYSSIGHVEA